MIFGKNIKLSMISILIDINKNVIRKSENIAGKKSFVRRFCEILQFFVTYLYISPFISHNSPNLQQGKMCIAYKLINYLYYCK